MTCFINVSLEADWLTYNTIICIECISHISPKIIRLLVSFSLLIKNWVVSLGNWLLYICEFYSCFGGWNILQNNVSQSCCLNKDCSDYEMKNQGNIVFKESMVIITMLFLNVKPASAALVKQEKLYFWTWDFWRWSSKKPWPLLLKKEILVELQKLLDMVKNNL